MKIIRLTGEDYTRYMKNRDGFKHTLKKALWDAHGNVRITGPSGRFIGIVRQDPGDAAPGSIESEGELEETNDAQMEKQASAIKRMANGGHVKSAPSPRTCKCAAWPWPEKAEARQVDERGKPAEHHPKCAYRSIWERQKGHRVKQVSAGPVLESTIHKASKPTNHAVQRGQLLGQPARTAKLKEKTEKIPHPDVCSKCKDFTKSKKHEQDQHHPTCPYFKKYKAISVARASLGKSMPKPEPMQPSKKNRVMLINLNTQEVVRTAEVEEIEEGQRRLREEGTAFVHIDGEEYLLAFEDGTTLELGEESQVASRKEGEREERDTEPPGPDSEPEPLAASSLEPQASSL